MSAGDKHEAVVKKLGAMWKALEKADQEKWKEDAPMVEVKPRKEVKTKFASRVESLGRRDGSELLKANGESWASALMLVGEIKYIGTEMTAIESEPSPYFQVYKGGGSRAREVTDRRLALAAAALLAVEGLVDRFLTRRTLFGYTHALVLPRVELARLRLELGLAVPGEDGVRRPYGELRPSREPHPCLRGRNPTHDLLDRCLGDARRYRTRVADAHDDLAALVSARARARRPVPEAIAAHLAADHFRTQTFTLPPARFEQLFAELAAGTAIVTAQDAHLDALVRLGTRRYALGALYGGVLERGLPAVAWRRLGQPDDHGEGLARLFDESGGGLDAGFDGAWRAGAALVRERLGAALAAHDARRSLPTTFGKATSPRGKAKSGLEASLDRAAREAAATARSRRLLSEDPFDAVPSLYPRPSGNSFDVTP